jgi:conjugal transfer pilus assembly protein TraA
MLSAVINPRPAPPVGRHQGRMLILLLALTVVLLAPSLTWAGTSGSEFTPLYTTLTGWMTGYLGRVIAAIFIIVGLVAGVTKGSVMGFVMGIAAGTGLFLAPSVIDATVSATLPLL